MLTAYGVGVGWWERAADRALLWVLLVTGVGNTAVLGGLLGWVVFARPDLHGERALIIGLLVFLLFPAVSLLIMFGGYMRDELRPR